MESVSLRVKGIEKSFPGVKALNNISFSLREGTVHVLCGENGAGKSTLMKIINGVYEPDAGTIYIDNSPVRIKSPIHARNLGISMIFQELNYVPEITVEENLFLGDLPLGPLGNVDWKTVRRETRKLLAQEGLDYSPTAKMKELSVSDIQMLEILKAVSRNARIIIMDEPTSAITQSEVERLFAKIEELKSRGVGIIYISHKMDEIFRIADEVTVFRDGELVRTAKKDNTNIDEVITLMVGRKISSHYPKKPVQPGEIAFRVEGLTRPGYFENVSFQVRKGEIIGFAGLMGAGRTEVMRALFGMDNYSSGQVYKNERLIPQQAVYQNIRDGIVMLSEDRRRYGIIPVRPVRENVTLAALESFFRRGLLNVQEEIREVGRVCGRMDVTPSNHEVSIDTLSGGNQQKVVLAKWMLREPDVLIMDEPTRGIDIGAKWEIYRLMTSFVEDGKAVIIVSSELPELIGMSDRIYVMAHGCIQGVLEREQFSQEAIMRFALL